MHIPDGFISPKMYIPAYGVAAGLWAYGARRVKARLDEKAIPMLAVVTALVFIMMMIIVPLPGGTSAHATGIGLLAVLFGVWVSFLSVSLVLLIQALLFGIGGITTLPIGAVAMGLVGSAAALTGYRSLQRWNEKAALFATKEGRYLYRLEEALRRLYHDPKNFGTCHTCGAEVGFERLDALPHARYCIDCKVKEEDAA